VRGFAAHHLADLFGGADRHRALVDDDLIAVHGARDFACDAHHVPQISGAVFTLRGAHRDETDFGGFHGFGEIGGKDQTPFRLIAFDELFQAGLKNGDLAASQHRHLGCVFIHTDYVVA
jgi:hypothetical protein